MSKAAEDLFGENPHLPDDYKVPPVCWKKSMANLPEHGHVPGLSTSDFVELMSTISRKPGYHKKFITKGTLGQFSKIQEEYQELEDAYQQDCQIMMILECADLLGAIEAFVAAYNLDLEDLKIMQAITKRAFDNGHRK